MPGEQVRGSTFKRVAASQTRITNTRQRLKAGQGDEEVLETGATGKFSTRSLEAPEGTINWTVFQQRLVDPSNLKYCRPSSEDVKQLEILVTLY